MSDVTAVVLSIGEPYTERALASLRRQTLTAGETIVVRDVSPFHCALNVGAAQVRTPYFLHVDADMILDEDCIAALRPLMTDRIGMVQGRLRDPLCGRLAGIRLVRTGCWAETPYADSIAPETFFTRDLARNGWWFVEALRYEGTNSRAWHSFGEHSPTYDLVYTLSKFRISGARYRQLGRVGLLTKLTERMRRSDHPATLTALIALTHGVFCFVGSGRDVLRRHVRDAEHAFLERLLARRLAQTTPIDLVFATAPPRAVLAQGYAASRATGAPLCLDLRDPWTFGFPHRDLARWVQWVERRVEASLLARADRAIFTCDDAARAYRNRFASLAPQHFTVIHNSFDPALRPPPQPRAARPTIIHFGNCYGPRTLEPVLHALAALRRRGMAADLRLLNLGRVLESDLRLAEQLGVRDWFEHRPMVPYGEAVGLLAAADLQVLLAYGDETGYVPAKFFDYLLSGAPILCVARPSELTRLVEEAGGRCAASNEVEAIADTIAAAAGRPTATTIARPRAVGIERFSAPKTTAQLTRVFDSILDDHRRRGNSATIARAVSAPEARGAFSTPRTPPPRPASRRGARCRRTG